jgi:hypothetical protein
MDALLRCAAIAAFAAASQAHATGAYVSASGGITRAEGSALASGHAADFVSPSEVSHSERRGIWRLGAGWEVLPRVALELHYSDYGRQRLQAAGSPNPFAFPEEVLRQSRASERRVTAWGLDLACRWPVAESVALVGRVGAALAEVRLENRIEAPGGFPFGSGPQQASFTAKKRAWAPRVAAGVAWQPAQRWEVQGTLEYLGPIGSDFAAGDLQRTGRSHQASAWLTLLRRF